MNNILNKLEKGNFIPSIHKQLLMSEVVNYIETIKDNIDKFEYAKSYSNDPDFLSFMDLRIKSNVLLSGFYEYLHVFKDPQYSELMITCNLDANFMLVAFSNIDLYDEIVHDIFMSMRILPVHLSCIDLDNRIKVNIFLYDTEFKYPGYRLN